MVNEPLFIFVCRHCEETHLTTSGCGKESRFSFPFTDVVKKHVWRIFSPAGEISRLFLDSYLFVSNSLLLYLTNLTQFDACAGAFDACWRMLMHVDACWRMLTHVDACWRMLTHVDACWRMLTHVDACWRRNKLFSLQKDTPQPPQNVSQLIYEYIDCKKSTVFFMLTTC